jgi:hypothetical protein
MLYICIISNKFDLNQAIRVSHNIKLPGYLATGLLSCWSVGLLGCCFPVGHARQLKRSSFVLFGIKFIVSLY